MCIAVAGKVIETDGKTALINYHGNITKISVGIVNPKVGEYCLVHAGCAVEIVSEERAGEIEDIIRLLEEVYSE